MTRTTLFPLIAVAAAAVVPTTAASIKVESGYAYYDSFKPSNRRLVVVVFKTRGQLPRRFDGLIRAGAKLSGHAGGSIASVGGRASRCYSFTLPLKDGRFYPSGYNKKGAKASPGSRFSLRVAADDANGDAVSSTKTITLRDRKAGDRSGRPIDC